METPVTTTSITAVSVSTRIVQSTAKSPEWIQGMIWTMCVWPMQRHIVEGDDGQRGGNEQQRRW